jgi:hypothetical protein
MGDYSYDVQRKCRYQPCDKTRAQDWADSRQFVCDFHRKSLVLWTIEDMMGNEAPGTDSQFSVIQGIVERLLILEGKLPQ